MIEDDFNDVLAKAIRGLQLNTQTLNLNQKRLAKCLDGECDSEIINTLAPHLNLNPHKLLNLPKYQPKTTLPQEIKTFTSPFGHLGVNAYTIKLQSHILIFDTGTNAQPLINHITKHPEKQKHLFITHPHPDHIACEKTISPHLTTTPSTKPGQTLTFNNITLKTINVAGHCHPATAYYIQGLNTPVCIVGDAIFAGSIGGIAPEHYLQAINKISKEILTLPPETIILSGHGPATSVKLEKQNNPFF